MATKITQQIRAQLNEAISQTEEEVMPREAALALLKSALQQVTWAEEHLENEVKRQTSL